MEMKNVPAVMKDAANVLNNFPLANGCGATLFYCFVALLSPRQCRRSVQVHQSSMLMKLLAISFLFLCH